MARYYPISPQFWNDSTVKAWDDQVRLLALYLLTCEHRNLEGLYRLPKAYVAEDLGWEVGQVVERMERLIADGFVEYDESARVIFVRKALKYQAPKSERQIKGAIASLEEVPRTPLLLSLIDVAQSHAPELHVAIREAFGTHSDAIPEPSESHA